MKGLWQKMAAGVLATLLATAAVLGGDPEDELKSAAVLSFLRYSAWPATADGTVTVGVAGRRAFAQVLGRTLEGKAINNRPLRLAEITAGTDLHCCQLIYVATAKAGEARQILTNARNSHVLTIGESDRFLDEGGAVNLYFVDGHIGFEASLEALDRAGISVSSNLLRLGQIRDANRLKTGK